MCVWRPVECVSFLLDKVYVKKGMYFRSFTFIFIFADFIKLRKHKRVHFEAWMNDFQYDLNVLFINRTLSNVATDKNATILAAHFGN